MQFSQRGSWSSSVPPHRKCHPHSVWIIGVYLFARCLGQAFQNFGFFLALVNATAHRIRCVRHLKGSAGEWGRAMFIECFYVHSSFSSLWLFLRVTSQSHLISKEKKNIKAKRVLNGIHGLDFCKYWDRVQTWWSPSKCRIKVSIFTPWCLWVKQR